MSTRLYYDQYGIPTDISPDGDFWEPISTLKAFLQFHPKWKAERKHRKARI